MISIKNCYIYTRVSTVSQVDGYSLDAQVEELKAYAEYRELRIVGEYCDAGKSGKNIKGRPEFCQMMEDIRSQKDDVEFVLVFKLSRFGRNAADILRSLQVLDDYGVNLVSVNEAIDSSTSGGRLTLAILSAVAEMERENIVVQFMAGRLQKIMNGDWGGGAIPYGYKNINHKLVPDMQEAEIVKKIFEMYEEKQSTATSVAVTLNNSSYKRIKDVDDKPFTYDFVSRVLDNPFYCGRLYFNRRTNKKERNGKTIKYDADHVIMVPGNHEALVSEELWDRVHEKRVRMADKYKKSAENVNVHLLSGIVRCPVCGSHLIGSVCKTKNLNGDGYYRPISYYHCRNNRKQNGETCSYATRLNQDIIDGLVFEIIKGLQFYGEFKSALERVLCEGDSIEKKEERLKKLRVELKDAELKKDKIGIQLDSLNPISSSYDKEYARLSDKLDRIYDSIDEIEDSIAETKKIIEVLCNRSETFSNVTEFLENLDMIFERMSLEEKKELYGSFIDYIEVFPMKRTDGKVIKTISFKFPLAFDGKEFIQTKNCEQLISFILDCSDIDIVLPVKGNIVMETMADGSQKVIVRKPTYAAIKKYVKANYGANIHTLYIAQIKRKYGLDMGVNYHKPVDPDVRVPKCPKEKELMIMEALKHFDLIDESTEYKEGEE